MKGLEFIDEGHKNLAKLKNALAQLQEDPSYVLEHYADIPISTAPTYIQESAAEILLNSIDRIPEFENFDIIVNENGILQVCPFDRGDRLAVINLNEKYFEVAKLRDGHPPKDLSESLSQRKEMLKRQIEGNPKKGIQKILQMFSFYGEDLVKAEYDCLAIEENKIKEKYKEWEKEHSFLANQLEEVENTITPMLLRHGFVKK